MRQRAHTAIDQANPHTVYPRDRDRLHDLAELVLGSDQPTTVADVHAKLWPDRSLDAQNKALLRLIDKAHRGTRLRISVEGPKSAGASGRVVVIFVWPSASEMGC